jgi:hypothetical protein
VMAAFSTRRARRRAWRHVEHTEARKRRQRRCIARCSRVVVGNAG